MSLKELGLPNRQTEVIEKQAVFANILISKKQHYGYPKQMEDGIVFVSSDVKLMAKDGSNNILTAIGLWEEGKEPDNTSINYFRPTTFNEFITAFKYTDCRALERFFRDGSENNTHLNQLMCSFLKNNLAEQNVDVKELATTSFKVKEIVDDKAKTFYQEKESFYQKKIQKFEEKINELKQEQLGITRAGIKFTDEELSFGEIVSSFANSKALAEQTQTSVEEVLSYIEQNKEVDVSSQTVGQIIMPEFLQIDKRINSDIEEVAQ